MTSIVCSGVHEKGNLVLHYRVESKQYRVERRVERRVPPAGKKHHYARSELAFAHFELSSASLRCASEKSAQKWSRMEIGNLSGWK